MLFIINWNPLAKYIVAQKIKKQKLINIFKEKIPVLAREYKGKLNVILKGSNTAFKQVKNKFLNQLKNYIKVFITKLYASKQIKRKNKVIKN